MSDFVFSVFGSIVGGTVLMIALSFLSIKARWLLTGIFSRLIGADLELVYRNKKECEDDLRADLARTRKLYMLIPRGNELQRDVFESVFLTRIDSSKRDIRILMPLVKVPKSHVDWVAQRESELAAFDTSFGSGLLKTQIEANIEFLKRLVESGNVQMRLFNAPHTGRIVVTDNFVYFGALTSQIHARDNRVYRYHRGGAMYENYSRYISQLWDTSAEPQPSPKKCATQPKSKQK